MQRFKLLLPHYIFTISGFAHNQPVWVGTKLRVHNGATIELTITSQHDPPECFNVPFPLRRKGLGQLVGRHRGALFTDELACLHDLIEEFAQYVAATHGWRRPYRPFPDGFEDCIVAPSPVVARGSVGNVEADEFGSGWFR